MNKTDIYITMINSQSLYSDLIYLACCVGVEYDYDIINHFIKHYKGLGVDEFLIILNTNIKNSEKLKYVQDILRSYNIREKEVWIGDYCNYQHTNMLMDMIKNNTVKDDWVVVADVDEFHAYPYDLKKLASFLEKKYEVVFGDLIDRLTPDGKIIDINDDTDLFKAFPLKTRLTEYLCEKKLRKVILCKSYIKFSAGQHEVVGGHCAFSQRINIDHFKWRGKVLENHKCRLTVRIRDGNPDWLPSKLYIKHYEKYGSFKIDE